MLRYSSSAISWFGEPLDEPPQDGGLARAEPVGFPGVPTALPLLGHGAVEQRPVDRSLDDRREVLDGDAEVDAPLDAPVRGPVRRGRGAGCGRWRSRSRPGS